jgi:hypothetical protein
VTNLLTAALRAETLDESLAPIMRGLGIETGDRAAVVFSELARGGDEWADLSLESRGQWLIYWLRAELLGAACDVLERP